MIADNNNIKIVIVEDNEFFNKALTKKIEDHSKTLSLHFNIDFTIDSYLKSEDFILNLRNDIDIVFTDFYLGPGINAQYILKRVKLYCDHTDVVVLSQEKNERTFLETMQLGANKFIYKDDQALNKACFYLTNYLKERSNPYKIRI